MSKRNYSKNQKPSNQVIQGKEDWKRGTPTASEKVETKSLIYNAKAFRDLQNVGSIEVKADPNSSVERGSYPYNIIAATNKVVDANYAGYANIEGNALTRLQNSNKSELYNFFDVLTINVRLNYLYLCYRTNETSKHNNVAVNKEMLKAFQEAISKAYSTMFTQLPYYTDKIEAPQAPIPTGLTSAEADIYGKMMGILHYQTVLQNAVSPLSKYIETRSLEQEILNMSYRRESPTICALFGMLKKKAFIATLNAIGTSVIGEYFDSNWYKQMNLLVNTPSRKSPSVVDPLMTATHTTMIPKIKFSYRKPDGTFTEYYDSDSLKVTGVFLNPDTFDYDGSDDDPYELSFEEAVYRLNRLLDVSTILHWARALNSSYETINIKTPAAYFQQINKLVEVVNSLLTRFTTNMTDVRTFIDKLASSGMVYWEKGMVIQVDKVTCQNPPYNVILHNMIAQYCGGSALMKYNGRTQRWNAATLWNKYTGIAEFDKYSGGSFLTFGLRRISNTYINDEGETVTIADTDTAMCLPIMFAVALLPRSLKCVAVSRKGLAIDIGYQEATISDNSVLSRLDPLDVGFLVKLPYVDMDSIATEYSLDSNQKYAITSTIQQLLLNIFGYYKILMIDDEEAPVYEIAVDPDYVCFLDVEIEDVSNEMIQFCRNYSPFRVMTADGKRTIGFFSK